MMDYHNTVHRIVDMCALYVILSIARAYHVPLLFALGLGTLIANAHFIAIISNIRVSLKISIDNMFKIKYRIRNIKY